MILALLLGRWKLEDAGMMDRTHLRWFTIKSCAELFQQAGLTVINIGPLNKFGWKGRILKQILGEKVDYLLYRQIAISAVKLN